MGLLTLAVLGTVGTVVASSPDLRNQVVGFFKPATTTLIPYKLTKQKLVITVTERGTLESSKNEDVINEVEGQTTILKILAEGSRVKKGDLVCELDSAALRDNLTNQEIARERALADYENAKKTREVAEIAKNEYLEGTYKQEQLTIQGEIRLAESELERALERLKWSERMLKNQYVSEGQVLSDKLAKQKAEISRTQAETKRKVLEEYTKAKQETELQANIEKAKSDELAKLATFKLEDTKLEKLKKQIDKTKLYAPNDGLIVYANDTNQFRGNNAPLVEEGATVRERQKIFSLPDISNMQVNTKVHESMVDRVEQGQNVKIRVDAFANQPLTGTVKTVQPLPDPSSFFSSDIKVYTTLVTIDNPLTALRPGMSAEVTILIDTIEDALAIPVTAVLPLKGKDYVYLLSSEGPKRQEVKLGATNDILIQVLEGLKEGDQVAMNPATLLTEAERNEAFSSAARSTAKAKDFGDAKAAPKADGAAPGGGDADKAKAKAKTKRAGAGGGFGGMNPGMMSKFQNLKNLSAEEREKLKSGSEDEKKELMRKAGFTDEELQQLEQMRSQFQGGGGGGGGFGGGGGGGPGGGAPGGGGPPR